MHEKQNHMNLNNTRILTTLRKSPPIKKRMQFTFQLPDQNMQTRSLFSKPSFFGMYLMYDIFCQWMLRQNSHAPNWHFNIWLYLKVFLKSKENATVPKNRNNQLHFSFYAIWLPLNLNNTTYIYWCFCAFITLCK